MFNGKSIDVWQNETISLTSTSPDATYETATLLVGAPGDPAIFSHEAPYVNLIADLTVTDEDNDIPVGEYKYMIKVDYTGGEVKYFPDPTKCSTDELPDFIVKERIGDPA